MNEIPIARPVLGEPEIEAVTQALLSGWVTQGPAVARFEQDLAALVGSRYACAVSSCTSALHLALLAAGVGPGDVVLTVSHSFIASSNAIRYCQAEPVFVDIDPATFNMSPALLAETLARDFEPRDGSLWYRHTARIKTRHSPLTGRCDPVGRLGAILVVHQVGMPADLGSILPVAARYAVPVVEDAACAIGSEISLDSGATWSRIGAPHGEIACFSFHPRKVITTGDGGMLTTNSAAHDRTHRALRHHGMSSSDLARHASREVTFEEYPVTGFNYRMTDIQAAVGIRQLARLPDLIRERREIAAAYRDRLQAIAGVEAPEEPCYARSNWQSYIVKLENPALQKPLMQRLLSQGISTRRGVMCAHLEAPYAEGWPSGSLPESERARDCGVILPLFPGMSTDQIRRVAEAVADALRVLG